MHARGSVMTNELSRNCRAVSACRECLVSSSVQALMADVAEPTYISQHSVTSPVRMTPVSALPLQQARSTRALDGTCTHKMHTFSLCAHLVSNSSSAIDA
jgi:hypothetical protein